MKANDFKQFAASACETGEKIISCLEGSVRNEINAALSMGASMCVSLSFDAAGHSTIRLEVVNGESRLCVASLTGQMPTIQ